VVAINRFPGDTADELRLVQEYCTQQGVTNALSEAFARGGEGAVALAEEVVRTIDSHSGALVKTAYASADTAEEKILKVAEKVYGAHAVDYSERAAKKLAQYSQWGFGSLPVCVAKTQYSFSDNPKLSGAPTGWTLHVSDVRLSAGAGFLVVISGNIVLMPGLPKESRALQMDLNAMGVITGVS
jgi:formate--tetrahydrofolate ligase